MKMRIVRLPEECAANAACLLYDYDRDGVPGVLIRVYIDMAPRDRWVPIAECIDPEQFIKYATVPYLQGVVQELVDDLIDLRLAVAVSEALNGDEESIHAKLDKIRMDFSCEEYAEFLGLHGCSDAPIDVALRHFRRGYEAAMLNIGLDLESE